MSKFRAIRLKGEDGTLYEAGFRWVERNRSAEKLVNQSLPPLGLIAALTWGFAFEWPGDHGAVFADLGNLMLFVMLGLATSLLFMRKRRAMVFVRGDYIRIPHSMPGRWFRRTLYVTHSEVTSIETRQLDREEFHVRLVTEDGDLFVIGWNLLEDEALKVAVQLTKALTELRLSEADGASRVMMPSAAKPGSRQLID